MRILRRYLAREIYQATAFVLVAFLALFAFFDLVSELRDVGRSTYRLAQAFLFVGLSLPGHIYELFPIAALVGTLYVLARLAANSEFAVLRTAGLAPARAAVTLLRIGALFVVLILLVGELLTPAAASMAQHLRLVALGAGVGQELRSGVWVRADRSYVNVRTVNGDSTIADVIVYDFDQSGALRSISHADRGDYLGGNVWRLQGVVETVFAAQGTRVEREPERRWSSVLTPDVLTVLAVDPQKMSAIDLFQYTRHLSRNRQSSLRYDIALWQKLAYPVSALVMMMLALPFGYVNARSGGVGAKVFAGVMLGVLFYGMNILFGYLGVIDRWPPALSVWAPSVLFLMAALLMMWRIERR
jgi:lipopolysaccharide export system permease protein